jgi:CelD/BcsL family acetyltransferase involved in cellulose biosynthesis
MPFTISMQMKAVAHVTGSLLGARIFKKVARESAAGASAAAARYHDRPGIAAKGVRMGRGVLRHDRLPAGTVGLVERFEDVLALEAEWRDLEARVPEATPFQGFEWCRAWLEAARAGGAAETLRVVTLRDQGRLRLLWPLAIRRLWGFRVAHWLAEPLTQYGDVLVESEDRTRLLEAAWREIRAWRDVDALELRRIRSDAALMVLPEAFGQGLRPADAAPFLDLGPADPNAAAPVRTSRTRNALRRRLKQLEALGPVRFEIFDGPESQRQATAEALRLKAEWLSEKGLASAGLSHPASGACLLALAARGRLFAARLSVGDATAALEIGLVQARRYYSFMQSYDLRFAHHGPGRLMFWHLIERFPQLGVERFDFLAPAYEHKREWAKDEVLLGDAILPLSTKGVAAASYLARIKPALKDFYAKLPAGARRRVAGLVTTLN